MSQSFISWVNQMIALDAAGVAQAAQPLKRNESVREFIMNRGNANISR